MKPICLAPPFECRKMQVRAVDDPGAVLLAKDRPAVVMPPPRSPMRPVEEDNPAFPDGAEGPLVTGALGNRSLVLNSEANPFLPSVIDPEPILKPRGFLPLPDSPEKLDYEPDEDWGNTMEWEKFGVKGLSQEELEEKWKKEEEEAAKLERKLEKERSKGKIPVGDMACSSFYELPLEEAGRRIQWLTYGSLEYYEAWEQGRVLAGCSKWASEACEAFRLTQPDKSEKKKKKSKKSKKSKRRDESPVPTVKSVVHVVQPEVKKTPEPSSPGKMEVEPSRMDQGSGTAPNSDPLGSRTPSRRRTSVRSSDRARSPSGRRSRSPRRDSSRRRERSSRRRPSPERRPSPPRRQSSLKAPANRRVVLPPKNEHVVSTVTSKPEPKAKATVSKNTKDADKSDKNAPPLPTGPRPESVAPPPPPVETVENKTGNETAPASKKNEIEIFPFEYKPPAKVGMSGIGYYYRPVRHYCGYKSSQVRGRPLPRLWQMAEKLGKPVKIRADNTEGRGKVLTHLNYVQPVEQVEPIEILAFYSGLVSCGAKSPSREEEGKGESSGTANKTNKTVENSGRVSAFRRLAAAPSSVPLSDPRLVGGDVHHSDGFALAEAVGTPPLPGTKGKKKRKRRSGSKREPIPKARKVADISGPKFDGGVNEFGEVVMNGVNPQDFAEARKAHMDNLIAQGKKPASNRTLRRIHSKSRSKKRARGEVEYFRVKVDHPDTREMYLVDPRSRGTIGDEWDADGGQDGRGLTRTR